MQVTFVLPDDLVERAQQAGLLTNTRVAEWLEDELRRDAALRRFGEIATALGQSGITEDEIEAELQARKEERLREN